MSKRETCWYWTSAFCAMMFFLLIAIVGLIVVKTGNQWLILPGIAVWIGNGLLLRHANKQW